MLQLSAFTCGTRSPLDGTGSPSQRRTYVPLGSSGVVHAGYNWRRNYVSGSSWKKTSSSQVLLLFLCKIQPVYASIEFYSSIISYNHEVVDIFIPRKINVFSLLWLKIRICCHTDIYVLFFFQVWHRVRFMSFTDDDDAYRSFILHP